MLYAAHKPQYCNGKLIGTWMLVGDEEVFLQHRPPPRQGKKNTVIPSAVPAPCTAKQTPFPQCRTVKGRKVAMKAARVFESSDGIPWWGLMPLLAAALLLLRDVMAPGCDAGIPVASGGWQHAS
jgi:hypothetical protein